MELIKLEKYNFYIYKNDKCIGEFIKKNKKLWETDNIINFRKFYKKGTNILDIGGFIGCSSILFSEIIDKTNKIYVFEPQYYECLEANIIENNLSDIIIPYRFGLANLEGLINTENIDLNSVTNYGGKHLALLHTDTIDKQIVSDGKNLVHLKKLDDFNFTNISLIKIMVSGFELFVLQGGKDTIINNNYPPILIEIWDVVCWRNDLNFRDYYKQNKIKINKFLEDLGYKKYSQCNMNYIFIHNK